MAVKLKNADPNSKYHYEIIVLDDECKSNIGVQVATKIASDKAVIGAVPHYCSVAALATVDVFHKFGLPVVVWGAVHPNITYGNDYPEINRVNGTLIDPNAAAAKFMTGQGFKTWAVLHDTTDYGKGMQEYITKFLEKNGGKVLGTFPVMPDQQDFTNELTQIAALKPDVVYFGGLTPLGVRIRLQMDKQGLPSVFEGVSGIISDAYIEGVGPASEGTIAFREGGPIEKLAGGKFFIEQYAKAGYAEPSDAYGPFAFAGMNLVLDAIEKVGPDRAKVTEELRQTKNVETIVGKVTFDDHGQNINPVVTGFVVQDKKWIPWNDSEYASGARKLIRN